MGAGCEFQGPGVGGGEQQETAGTNQAGQDSEEKLFGILDPIEKVGGENEVESSKPGQAQGVAGSKTDTIPDFAGRSLRPDGLGEATFLSQPKGKTAMGDQLSGGGDEGFGEINTDNLRNLLGEFE